MSGAENPIFVVGSPRSGTTLLRNLLRAHPRLSFPPETHFIPTLFRRHGNPGNEREAIRLATAILAESRLRTWRLALDPATLGGCRTFREVVTAFYAAWAAREGKPRWGDKTPQYATEIPLLCEIFPGCQIIHAIRDGRDVALSYRRAPFGPGNLYVAARQWQRFVTAGRQGGATLSPRQYIEVRYEALIAAPDATMRRLFDFLGEAPVEPPIRPNPIRRDPDARFRRSPVRRVSNEEIVPSNTRKWRTELRAPARTLVESVCGELLHELGYEIEGSVRPISPAEDLFWRVQNRLTIFLRDSKAIRAARDTMRSVLPGRERPAAHPRP